MNRPAFPTKLDRHAGWIAAACCVLAALGFSAALPGFSHTQHPLALLGAHGIERAAAYNLVGFVVPGLLAAWTFARLRDRLPASAGRVGAIGVWVLVIGALAFAAQGIWPLDPNDLDGAVSQRHATAWMLWWLSFAVGGVLSGIGMRANGAWRGTGFALAAAGVLAIVLNLVASRWMPGPWAQRIVLLLWLACVVLASRRR